MTLVQEVEQSAPATHRDLSAGEALKLAWPFVLLTLLLFGMALLSSRPVAIGHAGSDVTSQFRYWEQFGFSHLRNGELPLWNPHSYSGYPFFGNWQTALLYPINWLHLLLPWNIALNWVIAIHFFLTGWFTALWCRYRMTSRIGSALAGLIAVGGGGYYLHIYAGHVSFVCAAAWTPLILLCADGMLREKSWWWVRLGVIAVTMQILAGFPQVVYYTALMTGVYTLIQLPRSKHKFFPIGGFLVIALFACGIAAVQILVGLETASESVRGGGASIFLAASYSLAPENLATIIMPHFLGDMSEFHPYFGRWFLWETCLFVGSGGLCLAVIGGFDRPNRGAPVALSMVILSVILALGSYTGLFPILYKYVPLYGNFRVNGRFGLFFCLFMGMLAGFGFDRLRRGLHPKPWFALVFLLPGLIAVAFSVWMHLHPASNARLWWTAMDRMWNEGAVIIPKKVLFDSNFRRQAPLYANLQIAIAGATLCVVGGLLLILPRRKWAVAALGIVAVIEIVAFDIHQFETQPADIQMPAAWQTALADLPPDQRAYVPSLVFTDSGASEGQNDIWGYDPFMPRRYAEFMAMTQGKDPEKYGYQLAVHKLSPMLKMVRLGLYLNEDDKPAVRVQGALPQALVVYKWKFARSREEAIAEMQDPSFDPSQTVVLETAPNPLPDDSGAEPPPAIVQIFHQTTDGMEIYANLAQPGILLITDAYARGWDVQEDGPSGLAKYPVLPGDWCLRAIPLSAGVHNLTVRYEPMSYFWGLPITWISLPVFAFWCIIPAIRRRQHFAFAYSVGISVAAVSLVNGKFRYSRFSEPYYKPDQPVDDASVVYPGEDIQHLPIDTERRAIFASHLKQAQASLPPGFTAVPEYPFVVIGNDDPDTVRRYARHEVAWAAMLIKNDFFPSDPGRIRDVWLFNNAYTFRHYSGRLFDVNPDNDFSDYLQSGRVILINIGTGGGTVATTLMDVYLGENFPRCPFWFRVGFGELYWMPTERNGHIYAYPNWRLTQLQDAIRADHVLSFQDLITGDPNIGLRNQSYLTQARYLCYYMQEKGLLGKYFTQLQANIDADPTGLQTLEEVLGETDLFNFQSRWSQWVLEQTVPELDWVDGKGLVARN